MVAGGGALSNSDVRLDVGHLVLLRAASRRGNPALAIAHFLGRCDFVPAIGFCSCQERRHKIARAQSRRSLTLPHAERLESQRQTVRGISRGAHRVHVRAPDADDHCTPRLY